MALPAWTFGVAIALLIAGLLGAFLPAIPGVGSMWIVILVYAIAERFATIDPLSFTVLTILGLIGATADLWMCHLGAKVGGASIHSTLFSMAGALLGGSIGFLFAGIGVVPGMLVGSILGVFFNEYRKCREWRASWKATLGLMIGFTLSSVVEFLVGILMLVVFVWQVLRG